MVKASREFQIFVKPAGATCNLGCHYCYYLPKEMLYHGTETFHMPDDLLEEYIVFLIKQELIEERIVKKERKVYAITQRGITVLKLFRELKGVLPTIEETGNKAIHQRPYPF